MISQAPALGPVMNAGELAAVHEIHAAFDNAMLYGIRYSSNGIGDTSEMRMNKIRQKTKLREKWKWAHLSRGSR